MSGITVRLASIIGPSSTHGETYDFVTKLSATHEYLEVLGDGKQNKSYLYIDDCINTLIHLATIEGTFEIFNIGSKDRISVLDIANIVIDELSLDSVILRCTGGIDARGWKGDVREMLLDSSNIKASGWKAKYNSREAKILTAHGIASRLRKRAL